MGDLVIRISLMVQRGYICSACGVEIDGQYSDMVRKCASCKGADADASIESNSPTKLVTA